MSGRGLSRFGTQLAGVAFVLVLAMMLWFAVAVYEKRFTPVAVVTLRTDRLGNQLERNSEVKVRGVHFGSVRAVRAQGRGAEIDLALEPDKIGQLPGNVAARLLPKSAFGERYVNLVIPDNATGRLAAGDVIPQDRSANAIELERVLGNLLPLLRAVQPEKLNSSLGAVSEALDHRGKPLGQSIVQLNDLLKQLNPLMPQFKADVSQAADVANLYADAAPDILRALSDLTVTSKTIADQRTGLEALFTSTTRASDDLGAFLRKNKDSLIGVSADSRRTLELFARYSPEFPCLFEAVNRFKPGMEKALGAGTNQPGLHIQLTVQQPRGKYVPGRDDPVYNAGGGPKCPDAGPALEGAASAANSPNDRQMVREVMGAQLGMPARDVPDWGSALVGPLLRGTEVTVQ